MKKIRFLVILILTSLLILLAVGGASGAAETFTDNINVPLWSASRNSNLGHPGLNRGGSGSKEV